MAWNNVYKELILIISIFLSACSIIPTLNNIHPTVIADPTSSPAVFVLESIESLPNDERIIVENSRIIKDIWGDYYAIAEIMNISDQTLSPLEMIIEIRDKEGLSLIQDGNSRTVSFDKTSPLLKILAPGGKSPFIYNIEHGIPKYFKAIVTNAKENDKVLISPIVENLNLINDGNGFIVISGEIVNSGDLWMQIDEIAVSVINEKDQILSAGLTSTYGSVLAPSGDKNRNDRTPFIASILDPGLKYTESKIYINASVIDSLEIPDYSIAITNRYFDQFGNFHLVGNLSNKSDMNLKVRVLAGLSDNNSVILDVAFSDLPYIAINGSEIPFDISNFNLFNFNQELAQRLDSYYVWMDPGSSLKNAYQVLSPSTVDFVVLKDGSSWNFQGSVRNNSIMNLSRQIILVAIYDGYGNTSAVGYSEVFSNRDFIFPGDVNSFNFFIELDPEADTSNYSYKIFVQGVECSSK